jgi:hypothetical protein
MLIYLVADAGAQALQLYEKTIDGAHRLSVIQ